MPKIGSNDQLKWTGEVGETSNDVRSNSDNRIMMGSSFVGNLNIAAVPELNVKIANKGGKLSGHIYLWGMPKTSQEITEIKNSNNLPMTAIYTVPEAIYDKEKYVRTTDENFDKEVLNGKQPIPKMVANLSMTSQASLSNRTAGSIIPIKISVRDRRPMPLEHLCQYHSVRSTLSGKPSFSTSNRLDHVQSEYDNCYFFPKQHITLTQPNGTTNVMTYRLKDKDNKPIPGYHIPSTAEIQGIFPTKNMSMGYDGDGNLSGFGKIALGTWEEETFKEDNIYYNCYSYYKKTTQDETNIIAGKTGVSPYTIGVRGLKRENAGKFGWTPLMSITLYSNGDNEFFIESIPLTAEWRNRFDGNKEKFYEYVMSQAFWSFFRETTIYRSIPYINNYGSAYSGESWGAFMWLSGLTDLELQSKSYCWGFNWPSTGKNVLVVPSLNNGYRKNSGGDAQWCAYGVQLFHDKLWDYNH